MKFSQLALPHQRFSRIKWGVGRKIQQKW